ncbi:MAG: hypothetical protein WC447_01685 [Candidatus Paceibacterota bacterium]
MYFPLILFFLSLIGIIIMIWRELVLVRNGQVATAQHSHPFVPELQKIKHLTFKNIRRLGYLTIFVTLRFFIKSSNFLKITSKMLLEELKNKLKKNKNSSLDGTIEKKEVSKYLRIISEYQQKIRKMKHKIKEEEGIK